VVLRIRATHEVATVRDVAGAALDADSVYPMVARGRLVGMLALGPRASGEQFAPDESAAIMQVAAAAAAALDIVPHRNAEHDILRSLVDAVTSLREDIRAAFKPPGPERLSGGAGHSRNHRWPIKRRKPMPCRQK
jgi:hypothetical protein